MSVSKIAREDKSKKLRLEHGWVFGVSPLAIMCNTTDVSD
jgi:hypothetical protein